LAAGSAAAAAAAADTADPNSPRFAKPAEKPRFGKIAAVNSVCHVNSHAYHLIGRFLMGYSWDGFHHQPPWKLAGMFNDQYPANDVAKKWSAKYGFRIGKTVADALVGPDGMDIDGVMLIAEHGEYPMNPLGQKLYPRHKLFMEIAQVFRDQKRSVPVYIDKHFSYDHKLAHEMMATARELNIPLLAGSSEPSTSRVPSIEPPLGAPMTEGLVCHTGPREVYGTHALESLQCVFERRNAIEPGIKSVRAIEGDEVWKAGDAGVWSWDLLNAAIARSPSRNIGDIRENVEKPFAILLEYRDGAKASCLNIRQHVGEFNFAARVKGVKDPVSFSFVEPVPPGANYFNPLVHHIERLFAGKPTYPADRTLLCTTALDFAMRSVAAGGVRYESPFLHVSYPVPADSGFFRGSYFDL